MSNVFDYLNWRKDLTFDQSEFNEVDALIFSRLSYLSFIKIIGEDTEGFVPIQNLLEKVDLLIDETTKLKQYADIEMVKIMAESERYKDLEIGGQVEVKDSKKIQQFSAILFKVSKNLLVVAYRGTDGSEEGWRENFNMSYMSPVPAQEDSVEYLNLVGESYPYDLIVCGHSKGGNLAVYSSTFCKRQVQDRIRAVYNNDGPGFNADIIRREEFDLIKDRVLTFVPQSSIVGMLMEHKEEYRIIKSNSVSFLQHDLYSWQVMGKEFIYLDDLNDSSKVFRDTMRDWLEDMTKEELESFINVIFTVIEDSEDEKKTSKEKKSLEEELDGILKSISKIKVGGSVISRALDSFVDAAKLNIKEYIDRR